jgi:hypothetical protein
MRYDMALPEGLNTKSNYERRNKLEKGSYHKDKFVIFEVLKSVIKTSDVLWDVTMLSFVNKYRIRAGSHCLLNIKSKSVFFFYKIVTCLLRYTALIQEVSNLLRVSSVYGIYVKQTLS